MHTLEAFMSCFKYNGKLVDFKLQLKNTSVDPRSKCTKVHRDHEILMIEKSDRVKELQDQVETLQKRLAQTVADTSSQAYVGIKAMHEKFKQDQEKYATDLLNYQDEIGQLKQTLKRKVKVENGNQV